MFGQGFCTIRVVWKAYGTSAQELTQGKEVAWAGMALLRFEEGKIAQAQGYSDELTRLKQLGYTLAPPSTEAAVQAVKAIAEDLVCLCGNCDEESLATCMCDFAQEQRGHIGAALALGFGKEEIVTALVTQFGSKVRVP